MVFRFVTYRGGVLFNYGAIPQTWEHPQDIVVDEDGDFYPGDDDPVDALDISDIPAKTGEVIQLKVLGAFGLIDDHEIDWKVIGINVKDPKSHELNGGWCFRGFALGNDCLMLLLSDDAQTSKMWTQTSWRASASGTRCTRSRTARSRTFTLAATCLGTDRRRWLSWQRPTKAGRTSLDPRRAKNRIEKVCVKWMKKWVKWKWWVKK